MRMIPSRQSEEGAVAIIVTLCIMVIFGFTALVVDVGGLLTTKRQMVSASDSAALAAAQSCALDDGQIQATAQADLLAKENVDLATQLSADFSETDDCSAGDNGGSVTVSYTTMKELVFAPVLGLPTQTDVPATAKAIWGATGGGVSVPLQVNVGEDGAFPCTTTGAECNIYYDNKFQTSSSSDWGFLSLDTSNGGWPTTVAGNDANRTCPAPGANSIMDWISGAGVEVSLVQDPSIAPTYVCARDGNMGSASGPMFDALEDLVGGVYLFPVNEPPGIETNGREKYAIVGFIPLKITAVLAGDDPDVFGTLAESDVCSGNFTFQEPKGGKNPDPGIPTFDAGAIYDACVITNPAPATVSTSLTVYCGNTTNGDVATPGVDYTYDSTTGIVTWLFPNKPCGKNGGNNAATFAFTWSSPAVPGICPDATQSDPNAFCMTTEFAGPLLTGTNPNPDAPDFGARAIRLSS